MMWSRITKPSQKLIYSFHKFSTSSSPPLSSLQEYVPTYIRLPEKRINENNNNSINKEYKGRTRKDWDFGIPLGIEIETDSNQKGGDRNLYFNSFTDLLAVSEDQKFNQTRLWVNKELSYFKLQVFEYYAVQQFEDYSHKYEVEGSLDSNKLFKIQQMKFEQVHTIDSKPSIKTSTISQIDQSSFDKNDCKLEVSAPQRNANAWEYTGKQGPMEYKRKKTHEMDYVDSSHYWVPPSFSPKLLKSPDGIVLNWFRFYPRLGINKKGVYFGSCLNDGFGLANVIFIPK